VFKTAYNIKVELEVFLLYPQIKIIVVIVLTFVTQMKVSLTHYTST